MFDDTSSASDTIWRRDGVRAGQPTRADPLHRPPPRGRAARPAGRGPPGLVRRRDAVAQLRAADAGGTSWTRRPRRLLDLHLHQLAPDAALRPGLGGEVRRRRPDRRRRPHARVRLRARRRQRHRAVARLRRRVPGRDRQRLRASGAPSRTTTGRPSTSPMSRGGSDTTTSARASTPRPRWSIQQLLLDAGAEGIDQDLVDGRPRGLEVAADWRTLQSPETYVGYGQSSGFAQADVARVRRAARRTPRPHGCLSTHWALSGTWTVARHAGGARTSPADASRSSSTRAMSTSSWARRPGSLDPVPGLPRRSAGRTAHAAPTWPPMAAGPSASSAPIS